MRKQNELTDPSSCMSRAKDDEMTFVLLGRDAAAPLAIRAWINERIRLGKNDATDPQITEAWECAQAMEDGRIAAPKLPSAPRPAPKCGKPAESMIPRWGVSRACVLEPGHEGDCRGGGNCFKHGEYVGPQCPQWPDCAKPPFTAQQIESMKAAPSPAEETASEPPFYCCDWEARVHVDTPCQIQCLGCYRTGKPAALPEPVSPEGAAEFNPPDDGYIEVWAHYRGGSVGEELYGKIDALLDPYVIDGSVPSASLRYVPSALTRAEEYRKGANNV